MNTTTTGVREFRAHLADHLRAVDETGQQVTIRSHGRSIAVLGPVKDSPGFPPRSESTKSRSKTPHEPVLPLLEPTYHQKLTCAPLSGLCQEMVEELKEAIVCKRVELTKMNTTELRRRFRDIVGIDAPPDASVQIIVTALTRLFQDELWILRAGFLPAEIAIADLKFWVRQFAEGFVHTSEHQSFDEPGVLVEG